MANITIQPGKRMNISTSALYLSILNTNGSFEIFAPSIGLLAGKIGRQFVLDGVAEVEFINSGQDAVDIEYETANIRIYGSGSGAVNIENTPSIRRIIEPISVVATATFNDENIVAAVDASATEAGTTGLSIVSAVNASTAETNESGLAIVAEIQGQTTDLSTIVSAQTTNLSTIVSAQTGALNAQSASDRGALESKINELLLSLAVSRAAPSNHLAHPIQNISTGLTIILPARATRKSAIIQVTGAGPINIGGESGVAVQAGAVFEWTNQSALTVYSVGFRGIRINEDYY
jgi:hypothetical protein